jgi:dTDP-glucose 4,6-dehydratase
MSTVLVTGGAGFIGVNFVRHWRKTYPNDAIVVLDALTYAGCRTSLDGIRDIIFVHGDIRDDERVAELLTGHAVDVVVNFAAETHVDRSLTGPDAFVATNVVGTHSLLKAARTAWLNHGSGRPHRFHHVSTDEVYGSLAPDAPPSREGNVYAPNSPYSASKAAADHLVRAYQHSFGLQATISICPNNYGPYQFPEKLIPLMLTQALIGGPLPVYGDGLHIRDWLYVEDHCRGLDAVIRHGRAGTTYHLGARCERTNLEVVAQLCAAIDDAFTEVPGLRRRYPDCPAAKGRPTETLRASVQDRAGHDRRYGLDSGKAAAELQFAPQREFSDALRATVRWYLDNEAWWQALLQRRKDHGAG